MTIRKQGTAQTELQQPLPESGERVMMPKANSKFNKPLKAPSPAERQQISRAGKDRAVWEASPAGQARTKGMGTLQGAGKGMRHFIDNYDVKPDPGPKVYDRQLPGMADPSAAPRPPKWEELSPEARSHTERALAKQGTSIKTMTSDMGAQLDQAHQRAQSYGAGTVPYASRFYEKGSEPRDRIDASAKALGVPPTVHAMTNAFTSPNTKFSQRKSDGTTQYPNDDAAVHATKWVQQGGRAKDITNELSSTGSGKGRAQGYTTNIRKAATAIEQHLQGVQPADWRLGADKEKSPFDTAPKTGPYANSWSDSHPQFAVADVHTGGGGGFPHKSAEKPFLYTASGEAKTNAAGKEIRDKSERERALVQVPFAHSAVDFALRGAMKERNMGSVRRSQAMQWGEEQLQRGEAGYRGGPRAEQVYSPQTRKPSTDHLSHQLKMF